MIFEALDVGVPESSPISPLLFVIYIALLHFILLPRGITLSYVNDFTLTKALNSYRTYIHRLQRGKYFHLLLAGHPNLPKRWDFPNTSSTKPLPIDIIVLELKTLFLLNNRKGDFLTPFTIMKAQAIEHCTTYWYDTFSTPGFYNLTPMLKLHHFMKLDKFTSGRLHQFRAQKSYLASHQSWYNSSLSTRCIRCHTEPEELHHAILRCPMGSFARKDLIPDLQ
jgi:hypothetical protein